MSFRLFIYYCALIGGWAAFAGWTLGTAFAPSGRENPLLRAMLFGLFLGLVVALGLGFIDAVWNLGWRIGPLLARVFVALIVGALGGLVGGSLGALLYSLSDNAILSAVFFVVGWLLTGCLIGASLGIFEVCASFIGGKDLGNSLKKFYKCITGGALGGLIGGCLAFALKSLFEYLFSSKDQHLLWAPTASGFVALGLCIGLLVGLAQVILKEAWIRVEAGFRPGRELILAKATTTIGRAEGSDIALFGDPAVDKTHAHIVVEKGRYFLEQTSTQNGATFVNDKPVRGRTPLHTGDLIRVGGKSVLRFFEKQKRN